MSRKIRRQQDHALRLKGRGYTKPVLQRNQKFVALDIQFALFKQSRGL